jgi:EAL domain-containing protein (putative c-di-GMP-specific phosphodiesterase class I)
MSNEVATAALRQERDRFVAFSFAAADLLLEMEGQNGKVRFASGASRAITGETCETLPGQSLYSFLLEADRLLFMRVLERLKEGGRIQPMLLQVVLPSKVHLPVIVGACRLPGTKNLFVTMTIAEKLLGQPHVHRDATTNLLDADAFVDKAATLMKHHHKGSSKLTYVDLGDISALTKNVPSNIMERFLTQISAYMRSASIDGDAAGQIAENRFGIVHHVALTHLEIAETIGQLSQDMGITDAPLPVEAMEVSTAGLENDSRLFAKTLLYSLKQFADGGINNLGAGDLGACVNNIMEQTLSRLSDLRSVVNNDEFSLVFQPIVHLKTRAAHHYEVLSRFNGTDKNPFQIITFAEEVGMIEEFDMMVCQRVIEVLKKAAEKNKKPVVAINLSAQSLVSTIFVGTLRKLLNKNKVFSSQIMFELTESSRVSDFDAVNAALQTLRRDGYRVCLDDVGAGATSFYYIRSLQVDFVKIDGSYIRNIHENERDKAFVKAIKNLCIDLGITTIAEMVETEQQCRILIDNGVNLGQGWLFGKPGAILEETITKKGSASQSNGSAPLLSGAKPPNPSPL